MTKIRIFQKKEVIQAYKKWMKENHTYDIIFNAPMYITSSIGFAKWYLGNDSDVIQMLAIFPLFTMLLLMSYRHHQYDKQASEELRRI